MRTIADIQTLLEQESPVAAAAESSWRDALATYDDVIVVLDDDPTGTQTVHGVNVYTDWEQETLDAAFATGDRIFFVLTNSRSFSAAQTEAAHRQIAERIATAAQGAGVPHVTVVLRGDSTLRGHYPLEDRALREGLEEHGFGPFDGEIIAPAFFEGGRVTVDDVHYMVRAGVPTPVGETEFAQDATFGYRSSNLVEYVVEKSAGAYAADDCLTIDLDLLRAGDIDAVAELLCSCQGFRQVIVNAVCYADLRVFAAAFMRARAAGKRFVCRSAASLPKCLGGIDEIALLGKKDVLDHDNPNGGIVIVGSHVKLSTSQLECLQASGLPLEYHEFRISERDADGSLNGEAARITELCEGAIAAGTTAVVYTTRQLLAPEGMTKEEKLALSVAISEGLTSIVERLTVRPRYLIAKGGITSSDIATKGLGIRRALVLGQIAKGIPVWQAQSESHFPGLPYLIFPGNVGEPETLKTIVEELER